MRLTRAVPAIIAFCFFAIACHRVRPGLELMGAGAPRDAISTFLSGARAEDLEAMASVWGTREGPALAKKPRSEVEQALFYNMKCLRNDSYRILDETAAAGDQRVFNVELRRAAQTVTTRFFTVLDPARRKWFVGSFDPAPVAGLCADRL